MNTVDSPSTIGRTATKRVGPIYKLNARRKNAFARMTCGTGVFLVHAGAVISNIEAKTLYPSAKKNRADLRRAGKVKEDESGCLVLNEDTPFDSKSGAAYVFAGYNVSGPNIWKQDQ
jgi:hypothetical protein